MLLIEKDSFIMITKFITSTSHVMCYLYDPKVHRVRISRNVLSFENQYFIITTSSTENIPLFLDFSNSPSITRFELGLAYVRQTTQGNAANGQHHTKPKSAHDPDPQSFKGLLVHLIFQTIMVSSLLFTCHFIHYFYP